MCGDDASQQGNAAAGEPIEPGTGNEFETETDYVSGDGKFKLIRYYNSSDTGTNGFGVTPYGLSIGWRHNFSAQIVSQHNTDVTSGLYSDQTSACMQGFPQIAVGNSNFNGVSAISVTINSSGSFCNLSNGQSLPIASPNTNTYVAAERTDGSVFYFSCVGGIGSCTTSSDIPVTLVASASGYTLTDEQDTVESYNNNGALQSITYRGGYSQILAYSNGQLASVTDSLGRILQFSYAGGPYASSSIPQPIAAVTLPDGGQVQYGLNGSINLNKVTYPDQNYKQYQYTDSSFASGLTGIVDENQLSYFSIGYDSQSRAYQSSFAGGVDNISADYTNTSAPKVTDAFGVQRTWQMQLINGREKLSSISGSPCNSCNAPQSITYDSAGYYASKVDWNGNVTNYTYDDTRGLELLRTEAANDSSSTPATRTITTQWETSFRLPHLVSEYSGGSSNGSPTGTLLHQTTYNHDSSGNLTSKTVQDFTTSSHPTRTWSYSNYTTWGAPQTITGPRTDVSQVWQLAYYAANAGCTSSSCPAGQIHTITDPLGHVTTYTSYDGSGRPLTYTDANSVQTTLSYTSRGWLKSMTVGSNQTGGGRITSYAYWPTGQLQQINYPTGLVRSFFYNAAHQLTDLYDQPVGSGKTAPSNANHVHYTPDAMGNVTAVNVYNTSGSLVQTHSRSYNTLNQLYQDIGAINGETTTYTYDNSSNRLTTTDPLSRVTTNHYDALNRVYEFTDPNQNNTQLTLNALDQATAVKDPRGLQTSYTLDALNDLSKTVSPDSGTANQTSFDGAGNVLSRTDAKNQTTIYQYDALNRLAKLTRADGSIVTYTYDQNDSAHGSGIGRLTSVSDTAGNTSLNWTYNAWGDIVQKKEAVNGVTLTTQWNYAPTTGQLGTQILPSGAVIGYNWSNGLIADMSLNRSGLVPSITYFPFGGPTQWSLANGETDSRSYDQDGRVVSDPVESTIGYDAASRVTGWTLASSTQAGSVSFGYQNPMDFVNSFSASSATLGYSYDANGNRTSSRINGTLTSYTVAGNSNRLLLTKTGTTTTSYSEDANGDITAIASKTNTYDASNRLTAAGSGTYAYDGLNERVYKKQGSAISLYNYDNQGQLIGEYNGSGAAPLETVYLGSLPLVVLKSSVAYYVHADYRDTPRQIDNASGQAVWSWVPQPFGDNQPNQNPSGLGTFAYNLRYPGQYYDQDSGFSYNYHRTYNSATGSYLQSDPIGLAGGINTYAYVDGNPISFVDPSGLAVYVGQHGAFFPSDPLQHAAIILDPNNPADFANNQLFPNGSTEATLGAQAFGPGVPGLFGALIAKPNYPGDARCHLHDITEVLTPIPLSDTGFINTLIAEFNSYGNNLGYDPFPDPWGFTYNSNSFVSGLLESAGATPPNLPGIRPGYGEPIPH
jgi:RHS repeat-associated protein